MYPLSYQVPQNFFGVGGGRNLRGIYKHKQLAALSHELRVNFSHNSSTAQFSGKKCEILAAHAAFQCGKPLGNFESFIEALVGESQFLIQAGELSRKLVI